MSLVKILLTIGLLTITLQQAKSPRTPPLRADESWLSHSDRVLESFRNGTFAELSASYDRALQREPNNPYLLYGRAEIAISYYRFVSLEKLIRPVKISQVRAWPLILKMREMKPNDLVPLMVMSRAAGVNMDDWYFLHDWDNVEDVQMIKMTNQTTGEVHMVRASRQKGISPARLNKIREIVRKMKQIDADHPLTYITESSQVLIYGKQTKAEYRRAYDLIERARQAALQKYLPGALTDILLWKLAKELNLGQQVMAAHAARANAEIAKLDKNDLFLRSYKQSTPDFPYVK